MRQLKRQVWVCAALQVVAAFSEGDLAIMDGATLKPLCRVALSVLDPTTSCRPTELAAQPLPGGITRIAVGCSNGRVHSLLQSSTIL